MRKIPKNPAWGDLWDAFTCQAAMILVEALRRELWRRGLRYRLHHPGLPGRPDIVFTRPRVVVFCDEDFWYGRDLSKRLAALAAGHNAAYWLGEGAEERRA
jgi:DNA mismatch endonuclease Vsr